MKYLIYRSRLTDPRGAAVVPEIVRNARLRNAIHGITGVLVFDGALFCQYLEGDDDEVDGILHSIRHDLRHADLTVLAEAGIRRRRYNVWSMALARAFDATLIGSLAAIPSPDVADRIKDLLPTCDLEV